MKQYLCPRADQLRAMLTMGMAYYLQPGSSYCSLATGPSFSNTVRVAGPEDFATREQIAAAAPDHVFTLDVSLPNYSPEFVDPSYAADDAAIAAWQTAGYHIEEPD